VHTVKCDSKPNRTFNLSDLDLCNSALLLELSNLGTDDVVDVRSAVIRPEPTH